ncbi:abasic site processing protein HMCES-like [Amphiura filiformis]|uniref:abasic site processing protein HMCES-like n=1 Tax=Amphiura filiformis TaxID=82378 RepID=UPI003B21C9F4
MCGRTACTLDPQDVRSACAYTNRQGRRMRPRWRNPGGGAGGGGGNHGNKGTGQTSKQKDNTKQQSDGTQYTPKKYWPSYNLSPTQVMPVLVSSSHFDKQQNNNESDTKTQSVGERELCPMQWGLVPSWHKGNPSTVSYKMNNCRSEGMTEKVSFKRPFEKGKRCVVLADGFYEWKTGKDGIKQPYFIYLNQTTPVTDSQLRIDPDITTPPEQDDMLEEEEVKGQEWTGHRLLTMAGLFDIWRPADGSDPLYTFTVITIESHPSFSWLHHRMPAVLDGEDAIRNWLDYGTVPHKQAMSLIKAVDSLAWHPVTTEVGNSRYKEKNCVKPIELGKLPKSASSNLMSSWLSKGSTASPKNSQETADEKRGKKRPQPSASKPSPMMAWLKKANSDEKLQKVTGGPPTPKKAKTL